MGLINQRPVTSSSIFCRNPEIKSSVEIFYGLGIAKVSFSAWTISPFVFGQLRRFIRAYEHRCYVATFTKLGDTAVNLDAGLSVFVAKRALPNSITQFVEHIAGLVHVGLGQRQYERVDAIAAQDTVSLVLVLSLSGGCREHALTCAVSVLLMRLI